MIKANAHKYPVSAMCRVLQVNRSTYYYEAKQQPDESGLASEIKEIFRKSRNNYGTRKIKHEAKEYEQSFLNQQNNTSDILFSSLIENYMKDMKHRLKRLLWKTKGLSSKGNCSLISEN